MTTSKRILIVVLAIASFGLAAYAKDPDPFFFYNANPDVKPGWRRAKMHTAEISTESKRDLTDRGYELLGFAFYAQWFDNDTPERRAAFELKSGPQIAKYAASEGGDLVVLEAPKYVASNEMKAVCTYKQSKANLPDACLKWENLVVGKTLKPCIVREAQIWRKK